MQYSETPIPSPLDAELQKSHEKFFGGDPHAPFTDGVDLEKFARQSQTLENPFKHVPVFDGSAATSPTRLQVRKKKFDTQPLFQYAYHLSRVPFSTELSPEEMLRAKQLFSSRERGARKDVQFMFHRYIRVLYMVRGHPYCAASRPMFEYPQIFRLSDMLRVKLWPYRKWGKLGAPMSDEYFNLSVARAQADLKNEREVSTLVEAYAQALVEQTDEHGPLFDNLPRAPRPASKDPTLRKLHVATMVRKLAATDEKLALTDKKAQALDAAQSAHKIQHEELAGRLVALTGVTASLLGRLEALEKILRPATDLGEQPEEP